LSGENANVSNLITGTRYLNTKGMLPFENRVAEYVQKTGNHVLYRATPVFKGNNLLASGVLLEAMSVEDKGKGIKFCVYCYNVQPGIVINYENGENYAEDGSLPYGSSEQQNNKKNEDKKTVDAEKDITKEEPRKETTYIGNRNTLKFHYPSCKSVSSMKESNKVYFNKSREEIIGLGYVPCKNCTP
jgi:DNA-entry nuclease